MDCYLLCCSKKSRRKFVLGRLSYRWNFFILRLGGLHITRAQESKSPQKESMIFHRNNNKLFLLRHTALCYCTQSTIGLCWIRDRGRSLLGRAIKKLMVAGGGGWGGEGRSTKRYSRKGKLNDKKKIHARQLTLKNIHAMAKKISFKEFEKEKKFLRLSIFSTLRDAPLEMWRGG